MIYVGWCAAVVTLVGVLTAWMDPPFTALINASALLLASVWAMYSVVRPGRLPVHPLALVPVACAGWGITQVLMSWSVYPFQTWNSVTAWFTLAVIFSAAYAGFEEQAALRRLHTAAIWFGGVYSLVALLQWYNGSGAILWVIKTGYDSDVAGTFANRDHYAALVELLLPIALARATEKHSSNILPLACAGVMFASVLACGSRAGALVVSMEALMFLIAACLGSRRNVRAAAWVAATLVICTLIGGHAYLWDRFAAGNYMTYRREMLTATVNMMLDRPLTGFGLGSWPTVYPAFAVFDPPGVYMNHAHNDWAEWASDGGAPFVALMIIFGCAAVGNIRRNLWTVGIPAVLAHALVDFPLQKPAIACALFLMAGASFSGRLARTRKKAAGSHNFEPPQL